MTDLKVCYEGNRQRDRVAETGGRQTERTFKPQKEFPPVRSPPVRLSARLPVCRANGRPTDRLTRTPRKMHSLERNLTGQGDEASGARLS